MLHASLPCDLTSLSAACLARRCSSARASITLTLAYTAQQEGTGEVHASLQVAVTEFLPCKAIPNSPSLMHLRFVLHLFALQLVRNELLGKGIPTNVLAHVWPGAGSRPAALP